MLLRGDRRRSSISVSFWNLILWGI
jgi:hypothetical protein